MPRTRSLRGGAVANPSAASGPTRRAVVIGAAGMAATSAIGPSLSLARDAGFLTGQTLELLSGYSEGAEGGLTIQEWGKAAERLVPGLTVVFRPNPGGSVDLTYSLLAAAAPDGLTIGTHNTDSLIAREGGERGIDISRFDIIASLSRNIDVLLASTTSGITSLADLQARDGPVILPVRATVSGQYFQGLFTNALFGTRIRPVTGYSSGERDLAFLSGEAELIIKPVGVALRFLRDGTGVPILKFGRDPLPAPYPPLPAISEFEHSSDFGWIAQYFETATATHILAAPKGMPEDRLATLRDVFWRAAHDPALEAAVAAFLTVSPTRGEDVQREIDNLIEGFGDFDVNVEKALACGMQLAETGGACAV